MSHNTNLAPAQGARITVIDALRGFSLLGVILVHFQQHYSVHSMGPFNEHTPILAQFNDAVFWFVQNVLMGRFINIFAFLFGMSFFIQMDRAAKKGIDFRGRFLWRMVILFAIGIIGSAFYSGDILSLYAIYGVVLLLINPLKNWMLTALAALILLGTPKLTTFAYDKITAPPAVEQVVEAPERPRMPENMGERPPFVPEKITFTKSVENNLTRGAMEKINYQFQATNRGYITLAIFILGLIVGRLRFFETAHLYMRRNLILFALFIAGNLIFGWLANIVAPGMDPSMWFLRSGPPTLQTIIGTALFDVELVFSSASLLMAFVILYNIPAIGKVLDVLAPYGRMGLTNYVSQSIIGACLFAMWGLGSTFGAWGYAELMIVGLGLYISQIIISTIWLRYFKYGPLEWLWRSATYLKWQPFKK
ncbi:MAG: DUF418 domain-containing protein [Rikenellaceae bacterium]|nr:DUF418 domain-containing protein [Rikenellaceae bacterium]